MRWWAKGDCTKNFSVGGLIIGSRSGRRPPEAPRASDSPVLEALLSSSWPATTPVTPPTSSMSRTPATDELALVAGSSGPEESREDFCNSVRVAVRLDGTLERFQLAEDSRNSQATNNSTVVFLPSS